MEVLDKVPFDLELEDVLQKLRLRQRNEGVVETVRELIEMARPVARPKALYEISPVDSKNGDLLHINGVKFTSRVLRINLDCVDRVFPYVATCGREIDAISFPPDQLMKTYFMDQIKEMVMRSALNYLHLYLTERYEC